MEVNAKGGPIDVRVEFDEPRHAKDDGCRRVKFGDEVRDIVCCSVVEGGGRGETFGDESPRGGFAVEEFQSDGL